MFIERCPQKLIAACCAALVAACAPQQQPTRLSWQSPSLTAYAATGPYRVITQDTTLEGPDGREVPIRISFPDAETPFPLVVFSHGAYSANDLYDPLLAHWASHGFVVAAATHSDSTTQGTERGSPPPAGLFGQRAAELVLIVNESASLETRVPKLRGKLDTSRVGVTGHSLGGLVALALAGVPVTDRISGERMELRDSRFMASILISPPGALPGMVGAADFYQLQTPALFTVGTNDIIMLPDTTWEWHKDGFNDAPPSEKHLVVLKGADHYLGGSVGRDDLERHVDADEFLRITNSLSVAFLRYHLSQDANAGQLLERADRFVPPSLANVYKK